MLCGQNNKKKKINVSFWIYKLLIGFCDNTLDYESALTHYFKHRLLHERPLGATEASANLQIKQ